MNPNPQPSVQPFTVRAILFALCAILFTSAAHSARADVGCVLPTRTAVQTALGDKTDAVDAWYAGYYQAALDDASDPAPTCKPTVCALDCPVRADLLAMAQEFVTECGGVDSGRCDGRAVRVANQVVKAADGCPHDVLAAPQAALSPSTDPAELAGVLGLDKKTLFRLALRTLCESVMKP